MCLGIPAQVTSLGDMASPMPMGTINMRGDERECCFAYVPEVEVGDWVLIQNSFAMTIIDDESAQQSIQAIEDIGVLPEQDPQ